MFHSRLDAGRQLAEKLKEEGIKQGKALITSLSPGGTIIAEAVAALLDITCQPLNKGKDIAEISGKTVIIADDGEIDIKTINETIIQIRSQNPHQIIVSIPVYSLENTEELKQIADRVIILEQPALFLSPIEFYEDFPKV